MRKSICLIPLLIGLFALAHPVRAQETYYPARIEQIAGSTVYLNIGQNQGFNAGDTLFVYRQRTYLGSLVIISAASRLSSARFAGKVFSLTRGQLLQVRKFTHNGKRPKQKAPEKKESKTTTASSVPKQQQPKSTFTPEKIKPTVSGNLQFGATALLSRTQPSSVGSEIIHRTFITTYTGLQTQVQHLPDQFSIAMNMQWSYRYANRVPIQPTNMLRIFQFQVNKHFGKSPVYLSLGRFYNYYESFSGFWDGMMLRIGDDSHGIGLISGFDPIRTDEGFSSSIPKSSFYTYFNFRNNKFYSETELSANAIFPKLSGWNNHYFIGWHQQFQYGRQSLFTNIEVDQNPFTRNWFPSQIYLRGNVNLTQSLNIYGSYNHQKPYQIWQISSPISYSRSEYSTGLNVLLNSVNIGASATYNQSDVAQNSYTYTLYSYVPRTRFFDLGFNVNASYWTDNSFKSIFISPGITKWIGQDQFTINYHYYQSQYFSQVNKTQAVGFQIYLPLFKTWYFNIQAQTVLGQQLTNQQLNFSIWKRF